ncbi:MAG: aconitase/3-isopropylmalate dehydratase large subunit family protein [Gemmatimonadetes bacterium]|nr:aconitase/3-isopropylmalate dehydratase large subunit family protein [Gemmatimonadota bacterium]
MPRQTISEKILSRKAGRTVRAGDVAVCEADVVLGTDASTPMAIEYFEQMGGTRVAAPDRVLFALDHYTPPLTARTAAFHDTVREFAARHGCAVAETGGGISHQIAAESGRVVPGDLVVGADSHAVMCGALGAFATGIGSSDLAAALLTGKVWLRVPESLEVVLTGVLPAGVAAKDIALALLAVLGADGALYQSLEFHGSGSAALPMDDRLVLSNMAVESGAKAALFPADDTTRAFLAERSDRPYAAVVPDAEATYAGELVIDLSTLTPAVALPHEPDNVTSVHDAPHTPVHMVFLGTCTGGRVRDFRDALAVLEAGGGISPDVQLVVTPASREVLRELEGDGTMERFVRMGAVITPPGCGPCCGTSGPIPENGMNVVSTANRNFKARMGNASASIFLASPATCAAAAVRGRIVDPREVTG